MKKLLILLFFILLAGCSKEEEIKEIIPNFYDTETSDLNGFSYLYSNECYYISSYCGDELEVEIPLTYQSDYGSFNVTGIYDYAFYESKITKITLNDNITFIGSSAFDKCSNLTTVVFSNSITEIKSNAFRDCTSLENLDLSKNLTKIGDLAFRNCSNLKSIKIYNSLEKIGISIFYKCDNLILFSENSINYLGNDENPYVLIMQATLKGNSTYIINDNTRIIYDNAFNGCYNIINIDLKNVCMIGNYAFNNCIRLENIRISNKLKIIDSGAFNNCPISNVYYNGSDISTINIYAGNESFTGANIVYGS